MRKRISRHRASRPVDDAGEGDASASFLSGGTWAVGEFDVVIARSGLMRRVAANAGADAVDQGTADPLRIRLTALGFTRRAAAACLSRARRVFRTGHADAFDLAGPGTRRTCAVALTPTFDDRATVSNVLMRVRDAARFVRRRPDAIAQEPVAPACLVATVLHALRSSMNGIQLWSHVLEQQIDDASSSAATRRACDGIRSGIRQQVALIDRLHDAASAIVGDGPVGRAASGPADAAPVDAAVRCTHRPRTDGPSTVRSRPGPALRDDHALPDRSPHAERRPRRWRRRASTRS